MRDKETTLHLRLLSIYLTALSFVVEHLTDDRIVGIDTQLPSPYLERLHTRLIDLVLHMVEHLEVGHEVTEVDHETDVDDQEAIDLGDDGDPICHA